MNAGAPRALGARALCDSHAPGQRPLAQALVAWQSQAPARWAGASQVTLAERPAGVRLLPPAALGWPPGTPGDQPLLGHCEPWAAAEPGSEWIDLSLSLHHGGRWWRLEVDGFDDDARATRVPLLLHGDALAALASAGITLAMLRDAAADSSSACWACRDDGLGCFLALLIDLGWPA